jgi:hypothetical protein
MNENRRWYSAASSLSYGGRLQRLSWAKDHRNRAMFFDVRRLFGFIRGVHVVKDGSHTSSRHHGQAASFWINLFSS